MRALKKAGFILSLWAVLPVCSAHAEPEIIPETLSPDRRFVFAIDRQAHTLWLVRARDHTYLASASDPDFYNLPSDALPCWCRDARRVAVTFGGKVERQTTVFAYTGHSLKEMDLPSLESLRDRWFPGANEFRGRYIQARRWHGPNRLEISFSGVAVHGEGKADPDYHDYDLRILVEFRPGKDARVIRVEDSIHSSES